MPSRKLFLAVPVAGLTLILLGRLAPAGAEATRTAAPPARSTAQPAGELAGSASCAGRGCHGAAQAAAGPIRQNEYSTWLAHDRHAQAFAVLLGDRGRRIGLNLNTVAHEDERCLACHVNPLLAAKDLSQDLVGLRAEGVSCEACHGPASAGSDSWLAAHTTEAWKKDPERYTRHHMAPIADPVVQARTCAGCHVGSPAGPGSPVARDCNHDLMAAGHPRLTFELAVYRLNQPPHWRSDRHADDPTHDVRLWAVGRAVAAGASLELLAHRAAAAARKQAPWPEFAETDCFTCHADFRENSWRQNKAYFRGRTPGSLPYSRWYSALLPALAPLAGVDEAGVMAPFQALETTMSKPDPSPTQVGEDVRKALAGVNQLVGSLHEAKLDAAKVRAVLARVKARKAQSRDLRWEEAEQLALALAALYPADLALRKQPPDEREKTERQMEALFEALSFPAHYESPHTFRRGDALEKALDRLP